VFRAYSLWGVEPLFFLIPAPAQLCAYHELRIIPTPTQLSAYANHELKNLAGRQTARAKCWSRAYAQLERNITYIMYLLCSNTFLILSELSFFLVYARHMRSATLIFKPFPSTRFSASSLFVDDVAHMHRWCFDDQMCVTLLNALDICNASHRARRNPTRRQENFPTPA